MRRLGAFVTALTVLGLSMAGPLRGQPSSGPSTPQALVRFFLDSIVVLAAKGHPPADEVMRAFYNEDLLNRTRVRVAEDQFIHYWKKLGTQGTGARPGYDTDVGYVIGEAIYNDTGDEAITTSDLVSVSRQSTGMGILGILVFGGCVITGTYCAPTAIGGGFLVHNAMTVVAARQGTRWRLALPDGMVQVMEKLPTQMAAKRLAASGTASDGGLTLLVSEVAFDKDSTIVRLTVENNNEVSVNLLKAAAFATLADELGKTYNARLLKTQMPEGVPEKSSRTGQIGFDPVPDSAKALVLTVPDVLVGEKSVTFRLEISLGP